MPQELIITPVLNGFIVRAGCQTLVYDNADKIKMDFASWVDSPASIEGKYALIMKSKGLMGDQCDAAVPPPPQCEPRNIRSSPAETQRDPRR